MTLQDTASKVTMTDELEKISKDAAMIYSRQYSAICM
jgi:hypothetical protein